MEAVGVSGQPEEPVLFRDELRFGAVLATPSVGQFVRGVELFCGERVGVAVDERLHVDAGRFGGQDVLQRVVVGSAQQPDPLAPQAMVTGQGVRLDELFAPLTAATAGGAEDRAVAGLEQDQNYGAHAVGWPGRAPRSLRWPRKEPAP
ncbi:hypothetical protein GCM10017687_11750 [Streptomyces echinatus]|uniref:Uncharacterized protein n=1 Tax=Streptomyces echinatus TaxID=67293 RepID=A0A7W9Q1M3_9ACTN|nr:hypothetical protein [Streptomyces echinatus]